MTTLHSVARERSRAYDRERLKQIQRAAEQAQRAVRRRAKRRGGVFGSMLKAVGALGAVCAAFAFNLSVYPAAAEQERPMLLSLHVLTAQPLSASTAQALQDAIAPQGIAPNPADVHLLAATAWAEARSEGEEGMRAVAHVIVNRIGTRFGEDVSTVVLAPKQFSSWNLHDPNRPLAQNPERYATAGINLITWQEAQEVALEVLSGQSKDPTNGALFYHTAAVHPRWARFGVGKERIGAHVFYADVPDHPSRRA